MNTIFFYFKIVFGRKTLGVITIWSPPTNTSLKSATSSLSAIEEAIGDALLVRYFVAEGAISKIHLEYRRIYSSKATRVVFVRVSYISYHFRMNPFFFAFRLVAAASAFINSKKVDIVC